jgi:hypothetical protein
MTDDKRVKLRATWTREYFADPRDYEGCDTPEDMASLDEEGGYPMDILDHDESVFSVTVVGEEQ